MLARDKLTCLYSIGTQCTLFREMNETLFAEMKALLKPNILEFVLLFRETWKLLHGEHARAEQLASLENLRICMAQSAYTSVLVHNSFHILLSHVPYYLTTCEQYGGLRRFSQQGTEATVKQFRADSKLLSTNDNCTKSILETNARKIKRQYDEVQGKEIDA